MSAMRIDILTLFPDMFGGVLGQSILKIAQKKKKISIRLHDLRKWTNDKHRTADDKPYGGGSGMVMKVEPIYRALMDLLGKRKISLIASGKLAGEGTRVVLLTPRGILFKQKHAKEFSRIKHMLMICGHYEGVDDRVRSFVTDEISVGDYVLTGGEIPAMAVLDALTRLIPGVLGGGSSLEFESFENDLLEYPQYTRPRVFEGLKVPDVLLNGNHKKITEWREKEAVNVTKKNRRDLLKNKG